MDNPWDNTLGKMKLQAMDDAHFYQTGFVVEEKKPGLFMRIAHSVRMEWMKLQCRLATLNRSPNLMVDLQCECLES